MFKQVIGAGFLIALVSVEGVAAPADPVPVPRPRPTPPILAAIATVDPTPIAPPAVSVPDSTLKPGPALGSDSGLPMPRWAALSSDRVNMRTGPGSRYPISWSYARRGLPVEIVAEYEYWRKIRDHEGTEGWVHKSMLSGKRQALIVGGIRDIYEKPNRDADIDIQAEAGVQVKLVACKDQTWCEIQVAGAKGFVERTALWGLYPGEIIK